MAIERRDQGFWNTLWRQFAQSFVGSAATVLLGLAVAFVTGFVDMKKQVADLTKDVSAMKIAQEERDKTSFAARLQNIEADGKLQGQISAIQTQHDSIIRGVQEVRGAVESKKAAR